MKSRILITIVSLILTTSLFACSQGGNNFGEALSNQDVTKIENILTKVEDYEGKVVKVEGSIANVCPTGCWLDLKGDSGMIHITLPTFAIPQKVGKTAVVEGLVSKENGQISIIGKGVAIK